MLEGDMDKQTSDPERVVEVVFAIEVAAWGGRSCVDQGNVTG